VANLKYIGPIDEIEVEGVGSVKRDVPVSVPTAIAGRAPDARLGAAMIELRDAINALDHNRAAALRDEIVGLDPGEGLLAQSTWVLVSKSKQEDES
jgi:hypothetical protein